MDKSEYIHLLSEASVNDTSKFRPIPPERQKTRGRPEPVYNGHPRDLRTLNTGSLKILTGRSLMSILMVYHTKTFHAREQKDNQHSFKRSIL